MKGREADPSYSSLYKPVEPTPAIQAPKISSIQPKITPVQNAPPEPPQILTSDTITGGATLNATKRIKGDTNTFKLH
jgi:hypothetical protein